MSDSIIPGVRLEETSLIALHDIGTEHQVEGKMYRYGRASETLTAGQLCIEVTAGYQRATTSRIDITPWVAGVPQIDIPNGSYGWFQRLGAMQVLVGANCIANTPVYSTGTVGMVDDNATSTILIKGLRNVAVVGGVNAVSPCVAVSPLTVN